MDPGMEHMENSDGEHPQLRYVGCWAAVPSPELDTDVFANGVYMDSLLVDEMDVRPETRSTLRPSYCPTLDMDINISHADWDSVSVYPQMTAETGSITSTHGWERRERRVKQRSPMDDEVDYIPGAEVEMLLQPETRPISHNAKRRDVGGQQHAFDKDFLREDLVPKKSLYDPNKDAIPGKGFGKDYDQDFSQARLRSRPFLDESSPHGRLNPVNMEGRQPQQSLAQDKVFIQHVYGSLNEKDNVKLERDWQSSPGASPPVDEWPAEEPEMLLQPETRPISHDQLVVEVKGIYAGLVMVEAKCIDIDEKQTAAAQEKDLSKKIQLKNDQWQSLIALHKQLLHEHHDFFLASQHPAASPFEDTWIECLGDLGRYRMAIEDDEPRDRETWTNVARFWYNKAADKSPTVGRLYHHLAILARPYSLEQLSLYTRALTCVTPFESARASVITLFSPLLSARHTTRPQLSPLESAFIKANTDTQDESSTEHQLSNTFADLLRSALDQVSHWKMRITSFGKASGSFRWLSFVGAIRSSVALTLPICTLFIEPTTARTIPRNASNEGSTGSFSAALIPLAHWPYLAFVIITLLVAQYLAHTKDPIFVWGCMMSVWAFGWWTIRADPSTTLPISVVVLSLWAISAYQYGHAAFSKHRIPTRAGVIIIISAMILDVSTVTLMTPSEASTAQPQLLLSLALPLVSLILAAMVNTVAAMQSAEQTHALEERSQVHFPYIQEQTLPGRQQRRLRTPIEAHFRPVELPTTPSEGG